MLYYLYPTRNQRFLPEETVPPRIRRPEYPARQDARIRKHLSQAKYYWSKSPAHLADGDICQAGEKGWDTVAQTTKALAALRSWEHYDHVAIQEAITALISELPEQAEVIDQGLSAAERLHGNFYEVFMTSERAEIAMTQVRPLLQILWQLLPNEYTDGLCFDEWVETDEE